VDRCRRHRQDRTCWRDEGLTRLLQGPQQTLTNGVPRQLVEAVSLGASPRKRPAGGIEDKIGRSKGDVRVNQRASADAGGPDDVDAIALSVKKPQNAAASHYRDVIEAVLVLLSAKAASE